MTTKAFTVASEHPSTVLVDSGQDETVASEKKEEISHQPPPKPSRVPSFKVKPKKPPQTITNERIYAEIDERDEDESKDLKKHIPSDDLVTPTEGERGKTESITTLTDTASNPRYSRLSEMYQPSGSDSGNGSGDSVQTSASDPRK